MSAPSRLTGLPWRWLGRVDFADAVAQNIAMVNEPHTDPLGALLAFEPRAPVLTLGRRAQRSPGRAELAETIALCEARGIAVMPADRGGLATLHLPGQLVVFVALPPPRPHVPDLVCELLRPARSLAAKAGIRARIDSGNDPGLWSGGSKLASVGLRIRDRWVLHGVSVNVAIDSALADGLILCGHSDRKFAAIHPESTDQQRADLTASAAAAFARAACARA